MFQFRLPSLPTLPSLTGSSSISLPKPPIHAIEEHPEKRARTLKHLLKANHINHSIIYNRLRFHNHTPHILGSAYILGADVDQLTHIYEAESKHLEPWTDSPGEISEHDWREYLGKREYQRAWVDFFEDQLVKYGYDWQMLLREYLLSGKEPLVNCLVAGLGHPLIHLGYAYELDSRTVAVEGLAMASCFYNDWHVFLEDPKYTKPAPSPTDSLFTVVERVAKDSRFDGLGEGKGTGNIGAILEDETMKAAMLEHWNSWHLSKTPRDQFAESQKLAVALLVAAQPSSKSTRTDDKNKTTPYDFFTLHTLTTSHALRILLPLLPGRYHINLLRQWWLFTLLVYIAQLRPGINIDVIKLVDLEGRDWSWVEKVALEGKWRTDAHFVKALRCMREASTTWGDGGERFYLRAAVRMGEGFGGWGGFGANDTALEDEEGGGGRGERRYSGQGSALLES